MNKNYTALIWLMLSVLVLAGCEILEPLQKDVEEEKAVEYYKNISMREALNKVQADFGVAKEQALYFYSPNNYRAAQLGIKTARAFFRDPEKKSQVLKSIYKAEMAMKEGFEVKKIVDREMSEVVALRVSLNQLEARRSHGREYRGLATNTTSLIERVEKKKEKIFQDPAEKSRFEEDKKDLIAQLKDFQLRVVKDKYLSKGENLMAEAQRYDAVKTAPVTYAAATKAMNDAISYIEKNVENFDGIQEQSENFEFAAQRLMNVAREISVIMSLKENMYEEYVLREETRMVKIAKALNAGDIRNKNFTTQASQLAQAARTTTKQKQEYALAIAEAKASGTPIKLASQPEIPSESADTRGHVQAMPDPLVAGVPGGDLETLKSSVRLLTDQVYQMTLEISELKGQRDRLKTKISKLEKELKKNNPGARKKTSSPKQSPQKKAPNQSKPEVKSSNPAQTEKQAQTKSPASDNAKQKQDTQKKSEDKKTEVDPKEGQSQSKQSTSSKDPVPDSKTDSTSTAVNSK